MDKGFFINGVYFSYLNLIFYVVDLFFEPYCMQLFFGHFMESRLPKKLWNGLMLWIVNAILSLLYTVIFSISDLPADVDAMMELLFSFFSTLLIVGCFYRASFRMMIGMTIIISAIGVVSGELAGLLPIGSVQYYIICLLVFYLSLKYLTQKIWIKDFNVGNKDLLFLIMPGIAGIFVGLMLHIITFVAEKKGILLYEESPTFYIVVLGILILSLLAIIHGFTVFQDRLLVNRENNNRIVLEKQINSMQEYVTEMERFWSGLRGLKHDMRNTLSVVMQLSAEHTEKAQAELQSYLSGLQEEMEKLDTRFHTGNIVADTILSMKYHEALQTLPDLNIDVDALLFPKDLKIRGYDIGVILGNALDNALEACRELRTVEPEAEIYIRLSSSLKRKMFLMEIENRFNGELLMTGQSGFPLTKKKDKDLHGIGLENIKSAAEKYQGAVDWMAEGGVFTLSVMLKNM